LYHRISQSKQWKFPAQLDIETAVKAKEYLISINYSDGPVCLSCDDSKLHPELRTYWNSKTGEMILIGSVGPVRVIHNEDDLKLWLSEDHGDLEKATKV
jgi:hypothetical protein